MESSENEYVLEKTSETHLGIRRCELKELEEQAEEEGRWVRCARDEVKVRCNDIAERRRRANPRSTSGSRRSPAASLVSECSAGRLHLCVGLAARCVSVSRSLLGEEAGEERMAPDD